MSRRQGVIGALLRRERGCSMANDHRELLSYVEDRTASSCFKEKSCILSGIPRSTFLVCFSQDKSKMASTHGDHSIRIVDSFTGVCIRTLKGHPRTPWCIAFHPSSNNLLASGCLGGEVRIWDLMGGCEVYIPPDRTVIASIAFHPIDRVLLIATSNKLYFWKWDQPQPFACLTTNYFEEKVRLVKFSPFGDYILTGITNCNNVEANAQQNRSEASVNQLLQSVTCTQLDSDQVTDYIMQQTNTPRESSAPTASTSNAASNVPSSLTHENNDTTPQTSNPPSNPAPTAFSRNLHNSLLSNFSSASANRQPNAEHSAETSSRTRPSRNYRGVFAIFRARDRDTGGWNVDTSEVDSDPTDVGRSGVLFDSAPTTSVSSSTSFAPDVAASERNVGDTLPGTREQQSSEDNYPSNSSFPATSSLPATSFMPRVSTSLSYNLQNENVVASNTTQDSSFSEDLLQSTATGSILSSSRDDDVSQSISILPLNRSHGNNDVDVTMDTSAERDVGDYSGSTVSEGIEGTLNEESSPNQGENSDRYISGVGSVINVGAANSRTSYVAHGTNHSSSLSTLSNQEGSGTAIATATARTFRHVHTAVVIANGTETGPQVALRTAINRAIAGAFAGSGEGAVASNIINTTHRLQWWDFSKLRMPNIKEATSNVIVPCCKIHNDASCDLSADGTLLAAFVPSTLGFPDVGMLAVYSMKKTSFGQCLFTKKFGPNAISISLSPLNSHVVVGLAARRIHWHLTSQQMMAQVFKLKRDGSSDNKSTDLKMPVHSIVLSEQESERRSHVSVNAAFWHPIAGCGLVYGTNRGDLRMRHFGPESS